MKKIPFTLIPGTIALFAADQILKYVASIQWRTPLIFTSWLALRYEQNYGIAWSIPVPYVALIIINIAVLVLFPWFMSKNLDFRHPLAALILMGMLAGALGNLADRLFRGYVIDFLSIGFWPVFNLADALLTTSIFLFILFYGRIKRTVMS